MLESLTIYMVWIYTNNDFYFLQHGPIYAIYVKLNKEQSIHNQHGASFFTIIFIDFKVIALRALQLKYQEEHFY